MVGKLKTHKLVVVGDAGVGKTALVIQISLEHFVDSYDPTIEDSYRKQVVIDGIPCMLEILDTAGQEEYSALRDQWIRDGEGFIIAYCICSRSGFARVKRFYEQIRRIKDSTISQLNGAAEAPLRPPVPILLVGNKADRVTEREVSTQEGHGLAASLGIDFMEVSAKSDYNVQKCFYDVVRQLRLQHGEAPGQGPGQGLSGSTDYQMTRTIWGARRISVPASEKSTEAGRSRLAASLISAAKSNNERLVLALIEAGVDANTQSGSDGSPLHVSAALGHANIVNILLKKGAAVNARGPAGAPPLQLAAAEGHLAIVRLLIHKGALIGQTSSLHGTALMAAASRGRAEVTRFLLKKGASVSVVGGPYGNALQAASWNGNPEVIKYLLDAGADVRARGDGDCTALQVAALAGKAKAVQILLSRGAKIDIDDQNGKHGSAIAAATKGGHFEAVTLLLEAGARPWDPNTCAAPALEEHHDADEEVVGAPRPANTDAQTTARIPGTESTATRESSERQSNEASSTGLFSSERATFSSTPTSTPPPTLAQMYRAPQVSSQSEIWGPSVHSNLRIRPTISVHGFSTIHDSPNATVDIVFIHGLQGHPEKTWSYNGGGPTTKPSPLRRLFRSASTSIVEDSRNIYWPYDLLAQTQDFANTRMMAWGYDTKVIRDFFGTSDQQNISQHGNNLLVSLQQERKSNPQRPLIFVAHSLGGIVLKVALDNSRRSQHQPQYLDIYKSTKGIVFLGTPHGGAGVADWGVIASKITKCALQSPSDRVLRGLTPNSELLENLRKNFLQMLEDDHFSIHSFYETQPILGLYGLNSLVVPYDSSLVGHARKEVSLGLPGNHSQICKFRGADDPGYRAVFGALQDYVLEATRSASVPSSGNAR